MCAKIGTLPILIEILQHLKRMNYSYGYFYDIVFVFN